MINPLTSAAGNFGTFFVTSTAKVTKRFIGFKVDEKCTITELKQGETGADKRDVYMQSTSAELPTGTIIKCNGEVFTSITKGSAGSITLILEG